MPALSSFIKEKLEIYIYLSWEKLKKINMILYFIFINYNELACCMANSVGPDHLASETS